MLIIVKSSAVVNALDIFDSSIIIEISNRPGHQNCANRAEPIPGINGFSEKENAMSQTNLKEVV